MINIVGADQFAEEALEEIVALVGELCTANAANCVRTVAALNRVEFVRDELQCFAPSCRYQRTILANQRHL